MKCSLAAEKGDKSTNNDHDLVYRYSEGWERFSSNLPVLTLGSMKPAEGQPSTK